jgi:hypothetical protein
MTAALVAAVVVWALWLPPRRTVLDRQWSDGSIRGVVHVHSRASDGRGTLDEIAAAAAGAGLQFVIITDHGDGTRRPEPPSYRSGVLVIDAVEISTRGGHYVAVGLPQAPYPLGGDAASVVEDVHRLGGFGIAAHPDSPKPELRWADWTLPVDALEIVNPDTSWRVYAFADGFASRFLLLRSLLAYPARRSEAVAQLLTESTALREQWLDLAATRAVVAVAGADAHAKLALRDTEPGDNSYSIPIPSYESSFESLTLHVATAQPLSGDATADAQLVIDALRAGHLYVAVEGWATPPAFELRAMRGSTIAAVAGDRLDPGGPFTLHVRSNAPTGFEVLVWRNGHLIAERNERQFELPVGGDRGIYLVEVRRPNSDGLPAWITSNPIYVRDETVPPAMPVISVGEVESGSLFDGKTTAGWSYESDRSSLGVLDVAPLTSGGRVRLRYGLSGGARVGQYGAAAVSTPTGVEAADAVAFTIRAEAPMRISLQVRAEVPDGPPERWETSVYVETSEQPRMVRFDEMKPVGTTHSPRPPKASVRAILFVIDTTNTKPGASGRLWLGNVRLVNIH